MKAKPFYRLKRNGDRALFLLNIDLTDYIRGKDNIWMAFNGAIRPPIISESKDEIKKSLRRSWIETQSYEGNAAIFINLARITQCGYLKNIMEKADAKSPDMPDDYFAFFFANGSFIITRDDYFKVYAQLQELERGYR
jgi:hypothetical protein